MTVLFARELGSWNQWWCGNFGDLCRNLGVGFKDCSSCTHILGRSWKIWPYGLYVWYVSCGLKAPTRNMWPFMTSKIAFHQVGVTWNHRNISTTSMLMYREIWQALVDIDHDWSTIILPPKTYPPLEIRVFNNYRWWQLKYFWNFHPWKIGENDSQSDGCAVTSRSFSEDAMQQQVFY